MNPSDLVAELGARLNLTGLTFVDGVCRLMFDQTLAIDLEDDGAGSLCFHSVVGQVPHVDREILFRHLLSTHLFGVQTDGATFGVHPMTDEIYLFRSMPADTLDVETAYRALEQFTQHVEAWRHRLQAAVVAADDTGAALTPLADTALRA